MGKRDCPNDNNTYTFDGVDSDSKCCSAWASSAKECSTDATVVKPYACAVVDDCSGISSMQENLTLLDWEFGCSGGIDDSCSCQHILLLFVYCPFHCQLRRYNRQGNRMPGGTGLRKLSHW